MADLPAGTVTFLFTDIEGSTALGSRTGRRWRRRSSGTSPCCVTAIDDTRRRAIQDGGGCRAGRLSHGA